MSELAIDTYKGFIKEAFIDPIKSVLIIDDDYPTQDEQLFMGNTYLKMKRMAPMNRPERSILTKGGEKRLINMKI